MFLFYKGGSASGGAASSAPLTNAQNTTIRKTSATAVSLMGMGESDKWLMINSDILSLSTPISLVVSGGGIVNKIDASGLDAGSSPSLDTPHYAYASNSLATFAPSSLRLSTVAPTNGYLGASGNAANWLFVGIVTPSATLERWHCCGHKNDSIYMSLSGDVIAAVSAFAYATVLTLGKVTVVPGQTIKVSWTSNVQTTAANTFVSQRISGVANASLFNATRIITAVTSNAITSQYAMSTLENPGTLADDVTLAMSDTTAATLSCWAGSTVIIIDRIW